MKRIGGSRRKSRHKMSKSLSEKGKLYINKYLQKFETGEKVVLKAYPSMQSGLFNLRFQGKVAEIKNKQGSCYNVSIKDGKKEKTFIVHPVHLMRS